MSTTKTVTFESPGASLEFLYGGGDPEAFVTVKRSDDEEDDERVAVLSITEALVLAQALLEHVSLNQAKPGGAA